MNQLTREAIKTNSNIVLARNKKYNLHLLNNRYYTNAIYLPFIINKAPPSRTEPGLTVTLTFIVLFILIAGTF